VISRMLAMERSGTMRIASTGSLHAVQLYFHVSQLNCAMADEYSIDCGGPEYVGVATVVAVAIENEA
jgi:hypothetical protein